MVRTVLAPLRTLIVVIVGPIITILCGTFVILFGRWIPGVVRPTMRVWGWVVARTAGLSWNVEGLDHIDRERSYVVVSNHLSNLDPPLHLAILPLRVSLLAKKELFRIPLFGTAMRSARIVETDRQAHAGAHRAINEQVKKVVERKISLMIYPEGTRSRDGEMRPFKKGAFRIATDNDLPVLPVTISGTREAWPAGSRLIRGGKVRVVVHPPVETADLDTAGDLTELRDRVQTMMQDTYEAIRR